jgi:sigma-B regulation protein RsbU (phosphoserine phosphatase)
MRALLTKLRNGREPAETPHIMHTDTPRMQGADMSVSYFAPQVGGDFHDFARVGPTRILFGLLDVAGKRESSAGILAAAKTCFRSAADELFVAPELNESEAMIELSRRLNLAIMRAAGGVRSCPAFAGCYNEEIGTVCYVNAGHTPGLLRVDHSVVELPATGLPLGLFSLAPTDARTVGLGPKGSIAVVSRGVVEAESKDSEFGLKGVKSVMQAEAPSAKELSRRILEEVQAFLHTPPKHNDVTALTLMRAD